MATTIVETNNVTNHIQDAYGYRSQNPVRKDLLEKIAASLGYKPADFRGDGDVVVDLGSGGGFDCFLAGKQVGETGKVIGVDMTQKMVDLARTNAQKLNVTNVEFKHANINNLPLEDNSVDCVMSNCVFNLVQDEEKLSVIREIHRVLKPCGRLAVSDFLALKPLTTAMKNDPALLSGCISGAVEVSQMKEFLYSVGFDDVLLVDTKKDLSLYKDGETAQSVTPCCAGNTCGSGLTQSGRKELDYDINEWISSFQIYGHKSCGKMERSRPQVFSATADKVPEGSGPITTGLCGTSKSQCCC
ncbi:S-adenosyl-L-methionine-dependent methyltransferase [Hypomontagnella monticulosa]|nr:S-adenosyl-L-methionine-dependent methyltransferase [Hypomontagnella monticulosa]